MTGGLKYHAGPLVVNRLGFQVARFLYMNAAWSLRSLPVPADVREHVARLERDGCAVIPDFLSPEVFAAIRREYDASRETVKYEVPIVEDNQVVEEIADANKHYREFPVLQRELVHHPLLRAIVAGALRRPVVRRPRASARRWYPSPAPREVKGPGHIVGANYVHSDVHFPTFKAWLYLGDVERENGAMEFAFGSHHVTLPRLAYEYDASVRVAAARGHHDSAPYALTRMPRPEQLASMGIECTPLVCKANTLVLGNMQAFHRQGDFQPGTVREAILLCFRNNEPRCPVAPGDIDWDADPATGVTQGPTSYAM